MLLPLGMSSTSALPDACARRNLCFWHYGHLQVLAWFEMTLKKELATVLMQLTCLVVGGLPLVKRTWAIPWFSFLSLQVASSWNFSGRVVYLTFWQGVLSLASVYHERIYVFLYLLVALCPFNSVIFSVALPSPRHQCSVLFIYLGLCCAWYNGRRTQN